MANVIDIKAIREARGESQAEFALHFGVDQTTVHRWEKQGVPGSGAARKAIEQFLLTDEQPVAKAS